MIPSNPPLRPPKSTGASRQPHRNGQPTHRNGQPTHRNTRPTHRNARPTHADDERGIVELFGAILLFALLVTLLAIVQLTAVPAWNEQVEYDHNQRVQGDVDSLADRISLVSATGRPASASVETGTRYPARLFLVNPPAPAGELATTPAQTVTLSNVQAVNAETDDYWQLSDGTFQTTSLIYRPNYNEFDDAPVTRFEAGVRYNQFDSTTIVRDGGSLVSGNRLTLQLLSGNLSRTDAGTTAVSLQPLSAPAETITITERSEPITLAIPTDLPKTAWDELLASEFDPGVDDDPTAYVDSYSCSAVNATDPCGTLTVILEPGYTYQLQLSMIGIGDDWTEPAPAYLTRTGGGERTILEGDSRELTVQVRDALNNGQSGVTVNWSVSGVGSLSSESVMTDTDGTASVTYTATTNGTATVTASADLDGDGTITDAETITYAIQVTDVYSRIVEEINPAGSGSVIVTNDTITGSGSCGSGSGGSGSTDCVGHLTFENTGEVGRTIEQVRVNFYSASTAGTASRSPPSYYQVLLDESAVTHVVEVKGDYDDLTSPVTIAAGESTTLTFQFYDGPAGEDTYPTINGDFYVISVIWADGSTSTYFVAPTTA